MDLEAEWNELANIRAWVSETQLAGSTQTVNGWGLSQVVGPVYSISPSLQKQKSVHSLALQK